MAIRHYSSRVAGIPTPRSTAYKSISKVTKVKKKKKYIRNLQINNLYTIPHEY
jgi:hypothetical protein